jgi:hypothetical protein
MTIFVPSSPGGYTIFCDDFRMEANGKSIYIGVYNTHIDLPGSLPGFLSSFAAIAYYRERPGESDLPVAVKMFIPGRAEPVFVANLNVAETRAKALDIPAVEGEDRMISWICPILISPLFLQEPGYIRIRAYRGEDEIRMGSIEVRCATPPQQTAT